MHKRPVWRKPDREAGFACEASDLGARGGQRGTAKLVNRVLPTESENRRSV